MYLKIWIKYCTNVQGKQGQNQQCWLVCQLISRSNTDIPPELLEELP